MEANTHGLGPDKHLGALIACFNVIYDFFDRRLQRCACAIGLANCLCKAYESPRRTLKIYYKV